MSSPSTRPVEVLLAEDSPADARLTREVLREARVENELHVVSDGEQALAYLRGEAPYADRAPADILLLDLDLPRKDGREVLAEMARDPKLCNVPVVVLTTSSAEADIRTSYAMNVNAYVTKPVDLDAFIAVVRSIEDFWLTHVRLPTRP
jgi:two-component system, chemotaxis family, response regulator Rcp1